jgi:cytochrome c oxidase subunit 2
MKVDLYERIWMWAGGLVLLGFVGTSVIGATRSSIHPPSHVETIHPDGVFTDPRFRRQGITVDASGRVHAWIVSVTFAWLPQELVIPAGTPVTFHLASNDVTHGFQIVRTNAQAMIIPGYISQFTTRFDAPGEHLIVCNEYCGVGHHVMAARLRVVPRDEWQPPAPAAAPPVTTPGSPQTGGGVGGSDGNR